MICYQLNSVPTLDLNGFSERGLRYGAQAVNEPYVRPDCYFPRNSLAEFHEGKDASIRNMLALGNGWPKELYTHGSDFNLGCTEEVRDMRSLRMWERDLGQCMADKKRGATA